MQNTPISIHPHSSQTEREAALRQVYQQVLERQPYSYERRILGRLEKDFLANRIGVRRFLRELGQSEVYLNTFYFNTSNYKFVERCLKHFLGRALLNHEEMQHYGNVLARQGATGLITTLLDSEEYRKAFGCFTVPYARSQSCYESPKAYLEAHLLNKEHAGRRGHAVPTLIWHELGLNCDTGVCRHPEADEALEPPLPGIADHLPDYFLALLKGNNQELDTATVRELVASLSPQQRQALQRAIRA
ncbi:MAG: hypothetical protein Fur0046_33100 [Cyanobacteria bacterium J069]|nr:MAG: phycobilisome linker polypeptide [Cyanobacteria bacterium J069]